LLWNPDRDPHEILAEITEAIWGPKNGPEVLAALELIQDVRTGPSWENYWWTLPTHRVGTADPADDRERAETCLETLERMEPDTSFVPKLPLPYHPETFLELLLPHLRQIKAFSEFRIAVEALRKAAQEGADKTTLQTMLDEAWRPVPPYDTWIGVFDTKELREQKKVVEDLARKYDLELKDPDWLRYLEADRVLQILRSRQQASHEPYVFGVLDGSTEFFWPEAWRRDRFQKHLEDGAVVPAGEDRYRLAGWENWALHPSAAPRARAR
jgi:hypothetical protein